MPEPYKTTAVWTEDSLPAAIRAAHSTKAGTWGLLRALEGSARLVFEDGPGTVVTVDPHHPGLIPPEVPHHVELTGAVRLQVEFYHEPPL